MTPQTPEQIAGKLTKAQRDVVQSLPMVRGKRNGLFWACNDADTLADLAHQGLCKLPFADRWGQCDWQFVSSIRPLGLQVRAILRGQS